MICVIKNNCFKEEYLKLLKLIIGLVSDSSPVDSITVDDPRSFESSSFKQLDQEDQKLLRRSFDADIISNKTKVNEKIVIDEEGELEDSAKIFSPKEALTYLKEPLSILVENGFHDGTFIKQIIEFFGKDRQKVALDKCKFEFDNSGGCQNVTNTINGKLLSFKNKSKFLRFYVLWDSDRNYPNEQVTKYQREESYLQQLNIKYHILEKRAMENYLPINAYQSLSFPQQKKWFDSYSNLSDKQKDYYNIADGFKYSRKIYPFSQKKDLSKITNGLFDNLSESVWNWLLNGLNIKDLKKTVPLKFSDYSVCNYRSLNERIINQLNPNEFKDIISDLDQTL